MTSLYMPSVTVQIAFNATYATPAASRTWTDVSDYVEFDQGIAITVGRSDEQSQADANTLRLVFDNTGGRFTPKKTTGAYYPNVTVGKPIRVQAQYVGAAGPQTRFLGFIDEWQVGWEGSDGTPLAAVTASSALGRLGIQVPLHSVPEEEILDLTPVAYYTLGEAAGTARAADSSGNGNPGLAQTGTGTAVVYGNATGAPTDSLTAATFAGGKWLQERLDSFTNGTDHTIAVVFNANNVIAASTLALIGPYATPLQSNSVFDGMDISMQSDGKLTIHWTETGPLLMSATTAATYDDNQTHVAVFVRKAADTSARLYVDGTQVLGIGSVGSYTTRGPVLQVGMGLVGSLCHVAVFNSALSAANVTTITDALTTGFAGETLQNRLSRYARYGGIDSTNVDFPGTASYPVAHVDTTGRTALEMFRLMEEGFGGVLWDKATDPNGFLVYLDRSARYQETSAINLSFLAHEVGDTYAPQLDRSRLLNQVTATSTTENGPSVVARKTSSIAAHGPHSTEFSVASDSKDEIYAAAWWRANTYSEPEPRVSTLTVTVNELDPTTQQNLVLSTLPVGAVIGLTNLPSQASATTATYFVEGWSEDIGPESYVITYNVTPAELWTNVWILDTSTLGTGTQTTRLAY